MLSIPPEAPTWYLLVNAALSTANDCLCCSACSECDALSRSNCTLRSSYAYKCGAGDSEVESKAIQTCVVNTPPRRPSFRCPPFCGASRAFSCPDRALIRQSGLRASASRLARGSSLTLARPCFAADNCWESSLRRPFWASRSSLLCGVTWVT